MEPIKNNTQGNLFNKNDKIVKFDESEVYKELFERQGLFADDDYTKIYTSSDNNNIDIDIKPKTINIMSGSYNPQTNNSQLNGIIEEFQQGKLDDCYILNELQGLSQTSWGKDAVKNAVIPDGKGGAIVVFKGALGDNKTFPISKEEIETAQRNRWAAAGDPDVASIELAIKKYLDLKPSDNLQISNLTNSKYCGENQVETLTTLLIGQQRDNVMWPIKDYNNEGKFKANISDGLDIVKKYSKECLFTAGFKKDYSDKIASGHAYTIKGITEENGKEYITLINPWNSNEEIKMLRKDFEKKANCIIATMPHNVGDIMKNDLPPNSIIRHLSGGRLASV